MGRLPILIGCVSLAAIFAAGETHARFMDLLPSNARAAGLQTQWMAVAASDSDDSDEPAPDRSAGGHPLDEVPPVNTLHEMFAAIRDCWEPPPADKSRPGMEYTVIFAFKRNGELLAPPRMTYATHDVPDDVRKTYRDAIEATLKRCTPMHFTSSMAGAIAGRPIGFHFFDDRIMPDHFKGGDNSGK
jgi:hypothetical protein